MLRKIGKVAANLNIFPISEMFELCFTKFRQNAIKIEHTTGKFCVHRSIFIRKHGKKGGRILAEFLRPGRCKRM